MTDATAGLDKLAAAMVKVQAALKPAVKLSENPYFKSKYADLNSVWTACREALTEHGLTVIQTTELMGEKLVLTTTLLHVSGQSVSGHYLINPVKATDPQSLGSAVTYARRYALAAIVGVVTEDDDAERAMSRQEIRTDLGLSNTVTEKDRQGFWNKIKTGYGLTEDELRPLVRTVRGTESTANMTRDEMDTILELAFEASEYKKKGA
jgi:hypothetical protein